MMNQDFRAPQVPGVCHDSILPSKRWSLHKTQGESVRVLGAVMWPLAQPISGWSSYRLCSPSWRIMPQAVMRSSSRGARMGILGMISRTRNVLRREP
jgi:hypothetical protein